MWINWAIVLISTGTFLGMKFKMIFKLQKVVAMPVLKPLLLTLCLWQVCVSPVLAQEFTNISDIQGCRKITGEAERLVCYDTVSGGGIFIEEQLKQVQVEEFGGRTLKQEPEQTTKTEPSTAIASDAEQQAPPATGTKISVNELDVTIVRSKKDSNGYYHFQTSEGQVWKQQNAGSWSLTVPFYATIEAGALGSFFLVNEGGRSTRVKRVR